MAILNLLYWADVWGTPVTTAWIYWNASKWLISMSTDGITWITIADKNLWTTQVRNDGDTLSEANCGKYYQRWNNYWFPFSWPVTTTTTQVNASNYWPWNYYSSSNYCVSGYYYWDTSWNTNLWWYTTWTKEAMQWPCPSGFHIPTDAEFSSIINCITTLWLSLSAVNYYIKAPKCWYIAWNGNVSWRNSYQMFWTCEAYSTADAVYYWDYWSGYHVTHGDKDGWFNIRPFKNTATVPTSTWTKLY